MLLQSKLTVLRTEWRMGAADKVRSPRWHRRLAA